MNIPAGLKYTKSDEWVLLKDGEAVMGITDYAQSQLSDVVYVEVLPRAGETVAQGKPAASVESVKAAAEVYIPAAGEVTAVNEALAAQPELLNKDPYGEAWLLKFKPSNPAELDTLMDAKTYEAYCAGRGH